MFIPKSFDKYTNYNVYIVGGSNRAHEIEHSRLLNVIAKLREKYKNPYIRFMWVSDGTTKCVVYSDLKKNTRLTKLVLFDEFEKSIITL